MKVYVVVDQYNAINSIWYNKDNAETKVKTLKGSKIKEFSIDDFIFVNNRNFS